MSDSKYKKLFISARGLPLLPVVLSWMIPILIWSSNGWSQVSEDTTYTSYDSIQDIRMQSVDRRLNSQLEQFSQRFEASVRRSDSLAERLEGFSEEIIGLRDVNRALEEEASELDEALQQEIAVSERYRAGLKRVLWIFGSSLTILLVAALLLILFRLKHVRKSLREQGRQIRKERKAKKKGIRGEVRREVKRRTRKLKKR